MGDIVLLLIIEQLKSEGDDPDHWFVALGAITGKDPVPEAAYGNIVEMAEVWLAWAEANHVWWLVV